MSGRVRRSGPMRGGRPLDRIANDDRVSRIEPDQRRRCSSTLTDCGCPANYVVAGRDGALCARHAAHALAILDAATPPAPATQGGER